MRRSAPGLAPDRAARPATAFSGGDAGAETGGRSGTIRIGTSGWVYPHWRGLFYPEGLAQSGWLAFYMQSFGTVEINASFYRLPSEAAVDRWRALAPAGFVYAVKASRFVTHLKRLVDCGDALDRFFARARRLGDRLGPVLFQLPPRFPADLRLLADFAALLPADLVHVFEFRDETWHAPEIREWLSRRGLVFCIHDHGGTASPDWATAGTVYYRFHGSPRSRRGNYGEAALATAAGRMKAHLAADRDVYAYFNNDAWGCAPANARRLIALAGRDAAPPPETG